MASALIWHLRSAETQRAIQLLRLPSSMIWRRILCSARYTSSPCPLPLLIQPSAHHHHGFVDSPC